MEQLKIILQNYENKKLDDKINYKKILSKSFKGCNINDIKEYINSELEMKKDNKKYINILKIILIKINKGNNNTRDKKHIEEYIHTLMSKYNFDSINEDKKNEENKDVNNDEQNNNQLKDEHKDDHNENNNPEINNKQNNNNFICKELFSLYKDYFNIDTSLFNNIFEHHFINGTINLEDVTKYYELWKSINNKNDSHNNMSRIINTFNKTPNILYLTNKSLLEDENNILKFTNNIGFHFKEKDAYNNLKLKRGFIKILEKDNENYLLKFQPNKSFIEIIMNCYLQTKENATKYICFPEQIIMNNNNSYFYIIKKYDCDLYKFFSKKIILYENNIYKIFLFLVKSINFLHKNNIIYGDIKLENIIVNIKDKKINDLKIIDFDVSLFNDLPECLNLFDDKIKKIFSAKKMRGTKIYMKKTEIMTFKNDIYSMGVFILILLFKNISNILNEEKDIIGENMYEKIKKKLNIYKNKIEDDPTKTELLDYIVRIYKNRRFSKYWNNENVSINKIRKIIQKCLNTEYEIDLLLEELKTISS